VKNSFTLLAIPDTHPWISTRASPNLLRLAPTGAAIIQDAPRRRVRADIAQSGSITIIAVDARQFTAVTSSDALNVDIPLALGAAVATRSIELAIVFGVEVDNLQVMLADGQE
jgi:hypothetical protein